MKTITGGLFAGEIHGVLKMKIRENGMPAENQWEDFFNPEKILLTMGFDHSVANSVDFGCGYGTFTTRIKADKCDNICY